MGDIDFLSAYLGECLAPRALHCVKHWQMILIHFSCETSQVYHKEKCHKGRRRRRRRRDGTLWKKERFATRASVSLFEMNLCLLCRR